MSGWAAGEAQGRGSTRFFVSGPVSEVVNGLHLYCGAFSTSGHSKRCTISPNLHPFMHTFTHTTVESTTQGDGQLGRGSQGEASRSGTLEERGGAGE